MNTAWVFVLASYGIASLCLGFLTIRAIGRYRKAVRQVRMRQHTHHSL